MYTPLLTAIGLVLALGGLFCGLMLGAGCSENLHPGTARKDVCDTLGGSIWSWFGAVLWPVGLLWASQVVPPLRRHVLPVAGLVAALMAGFWIAVLMVVSGNWLAG